MTRHGDDELRALSHPDRVPAPVVAAVSMLGAKAERPQVCGWLQPVWEGTDCLIGSPHADPAATAGCWRTCAAVRKRLCTHVRIVRSQHRC